MGRDLFFHNQKKIKLLILDLLPHVHHPFDTADAYKFLAEFRKNVKRAQEQEEEVDRVEEVSFEIFLSQQPKILKDVYSSINFYFSFWDFQILEDKWRWKIFLLG